MFLYLSKALPPFLYPPGLNILLILLSVFLRRRRPASAALLLTFSLASLWLLSTQLVSEPLIRSLESRYPAISVASALPSDAIVVLGGYLHTRDAEHPVSEMTEAIDRLWIGARLYKAGKAPIILLTGGNIPMFTAPDTVSESVAAKELLQEWGIPADAILVEQNSRNTRENAAFSAPILAARGAKRIILVTSAFHMPRSVAIFRKLGLPVTPFPTDYLTGWEHADPVLRLLPDAKELRDTQYALKEWLGLAVYRVRGWA